MAGVHRLEHVEALAPSALPHDDPVRTHAEGVADQVADRDRALALDVRWPRLQPDDVLLLQLELDGVLACLLYRLQTTVTLCENRDFPPPLQGPHRPVAQHGDPRD